MPLPSLSHPLKTPHMMAKPLHMGLFREYCCSGQSLALAFEQKTLVSPQYHQYGDRGLGPTGFPPDPLVTVKS